MPDSDSTTTLDVRALQSHIDRRFDQALEAIRDAKLRFCGPSTIRLDPSR